MYGESVGGQAYVVILHAAESVCQEFSDDLFFDRDLVWHGQHLGLPGHVAVADLVLEGTRLLTTARFSDSVQRIGRRRQYKTRIERVFRGWDRMLLNGILHFAIRHGVREIWFPTPDLALKNTDRARSPQRMLFDRIYGSHIAPWKPRCQGDTWVVDVASIVNLAVEPVLQSDVIDLARTVCIVHDTERGTGHLDVDPVFAARAELSSPASLEAMLAIEADAGVTTSYAVVGNFLHEVRGAIEAGGHSVLFHSFDHAISGDQPLACRRVDYRLPGYRPPRSLLTHWHSDRHLEYHNFEYLASSTRSLGTRQPIVTGGLAKIPILTDDFPLHTGASHFGPWWENVQSLVRSESFVAFGLHDCYAERWLEHYPEMLETLQDGAVLRSLDDVANGLWRAAAV
ncbi:MAG: hypothetical protein WCJ18_00340 [Planctomycetota bacterium]